MLAFNSLRTVEAVEDGGHLGGEERTEAGLENVVERNGVIVFDIDAQDDPEQS